MDRRDREEECTDTCTLMVKTERKAVLCAAHDNPAKKTGEHTRATRRERERERERNAP